ncbi:hypothetical protein XNC3_590023 [Xenorhabdus nematophila F1]|nr:hypothetical protein XNC3_590023 [Xenorhabdus nematophila F1]
MFIRSDIDHVLFAWGFHLHDPLLHWCFVPTSLGVEHLFS